MSGEELVLDPGYLLPYLWSNGSLDPMISVNDIGWYSVTVTNQAGCIGADSVCSCRIVLQGFMFQLLSAQIRMGKMMFLKRIPERWKISVNNL
ncbi:MAG: hypothetical protein IPM91_17665 [Bacteroidetes bacterium]|nr:hypothetical protein [Bacteroidota bacterium]